MIRKAESKDIILGKELILVGDDEKLFIMKISEVLDPLDEWKAYVAQDGCRYGLGSSWVLEKEDNKKLRIKTNLAVRKVIEECNGWKNMEKTTWWEVEELIKDAIKDVFLGADE